MILLGRNASNLTETKNQLSSSSSTTSYSIYAVDVVDEKKIAEIAAVVGTWDVLVLNAGFTSSPAPIAQTSSVNDWWQSFEVRR